MHFLNHSTRGTYPHIIIQNEALSTIPPSYDPARVMELVLVVVGLNLAPI